MQQIVFKREFYFLYEGVKTENVQYLEEKIQPINMIVIEKIKKKKTSEFYFPDIQIDFQKYLFELFLLHTKFSINRTSRLGMRYTQIERFTERFTNSLFYYYKRLVSSNR